MNNKEQVENVKKALDLSNLIVMYADNLKNFESKVYTKPLPTAPTKEICKGDYPDAKAKLKINWKVLLIIEALICLVVYTLALFGLNLFELVLVYPIVYLIIAIIKKNKESQNIEQSESYRQACAKAERDRMQKQKMLDEEYSAKLEKYNNYILPAYEKEKADWLGKINADKRNAEFNLSNATDALNKHYEKTKIVPINYRNIPALEYIYSIISTSDFTVKEAIENYDRRNSNIIQAASLYEQKASNELLAQQNQLRAEYNQTANKYNTLLQEQNEIADKTRLAAEKSAHQQEKLNDEIERLEREAGLRW